MSKLTHIIKYLANFSCFTIKRITSDWLPQRKNLDWNMLRLICNFLGYFYKRLVMFNKTIESFFKKIGFKTQSNIETLHSQVLSKSNEM